ncbi:MAG: hypothetical protein Q4B02_11130 [Propionibacteriaceae bacterium]|jgi:hypothetical protein|nr:hypothetical protein [Propionibacteriaceae bacterium]
MGYFAVLVQDEDKTYAKAVKIVRLHVNIWALRGLSFGRRRRLFYFDVGMELKFGDEKNMDEGGKNKDASIKAVEFLLPFRVEEIKRQDCSLGAQDLFGMITNDHSGPLVFGSPVEIGGSGNGKAQIKFENITLNAARVTESKIRQIEGHIFSADSSAYVVPLWHPIRYGDSAYIRVRWRVFGMAPLWRWVHSGSSAWVDFRVCDARQKRTSLRDPDLLSRLLPIESANIFIMAPGDLVPTNVSPEPKYIRTLEAGAWMDYLKGAARWEWMARDLLVYGWNRPKKDKDITEDYPFRVFLALSRSANRSIITGLVWSAIAGFVIAWFITGGNIDISIMGWDMSPIWNFLGFGSITLMWLWKAVQVTRSFFVNRWRRIRQFFRSIEHFILS